MTLKGIVKVEKNLEAYSGNKKHPEALYIYIYSKNRVYTRLQENLQKLRRTPFSFQ